MKDLTQLTLADLWREVKEDEDSLWGDLKLEARMALKRLLEGCLLEEQRIQIGAGWHERSGNRQDHRNGFYERDLETTLGLIPKIQVPRNRQRGFRHQVFRRYKRKEREVEELIREAFLCGLATRKISEVLSPIVGAPISAQTVSNIARSLDLEVKLFHRRPLSDLYRYLFLDAIVLRVKSAQRSTKRVILCAYGIDILGKRELISFRQAPSEAEECWYPFVDDLYRRGLKGKSLELLITDGSSGLHLALEVVYPHIPRQRCWVHKLRNLASKLPQRAQETCLFEAKLLYGQNNKKEATRAFRAWMDKWAKTYPKAAACLEKDIDELLSFYDFPSSHRKKIRTTNAIERAFREIRRRIRPMSCFENPKSCDRIIYGVISHLNRYWEDKPIKEITQ